MENDKLFNKISIGLSIDIALEEYVKLFHKYNKYIHDIYFSLPLGDKFHTREKIVAQFMDPINIKKFYQIIDLCKYNEIKLDCVLNRPSLSLDDVKKAIPYMKNIEIDQITCLERHANYLKEEFSNIPFIYSYNNDFTMNKLDDISSIFSTIVVGKNMLRDVNSLKQITEKGFKIKLLVNNGCSYNCGGCTKGNKQCQKVFANNLKILDINYLYALQSFFPNELDELLNSPKLDIETIKISNRTDDFDYIDKCLESYIYNYDVQKYIDVDTIYYRLWSRLFHFNKYLDELDVDKIIEIKRKLKKD